MRLLLDTNICIYALNRRPPEVLERLEAIGSTGVALSVITVLELRHGAHKSQHSEKSHSKLDHFLSPMRILPFDEKAAAETAKLRAHLEMQGQKIGDLDSLIAGHALARDLILVSNKLREFNRVPQLRTENWTTTA